MWVNEGEVAGCDLPDEERNFHGSNSSSHRLPIDCLLWKNYIELLTCVWLGDRPPSAKSGRTERVGHSSRLSRELNREGTACDGA